MKNTILIALVGSLAIACGMIPGTNTSTNTNANVANTASNATANTANANVANANANANSNANTAAPANTGPKRISFGKGQSSAAENVLLQPGESKKFVIGVKAGQYLSIDSSAKEATISILTKGKTTDVSEEDGNYYATTTAAGDIIFQITNATKKLFKSSINVNIEYQGE